MKRYIFIIIMVAMSAGAAVYRVSPTNDVGSVMRKLRSGDKVIFSVGKYRQRVVLNKIKGSEKSPVIIRGEKGAIIIPKEQDGILVQNSEYINISGFEISGAWRAGILVFASKYINCLLYTSPSPRD